MMCLWESYKKKIRKQIFFAFLKSMKKGVGSGSIIQRYGSGNPDPDPHQKCEGSPTLVSGYTTFS
jgi:hypothetical protein